MATERIQLDMTREAHHASKEQNANDSSKEQDINIASEEQNANDASKEHDTTEGDDTIAPSDGGPERPRKSPITAYTVCSKQLLDYMGAQKYAGDILGARSGFGFSQTFRRSVYREDMGDYVLDSIRRTVTDAILHRTSRTLHGGKMVEPVKSWDEIKNIGHRESILWLPSLEQSGDKHHAQDVNASPGPSAYATFDVEGVAYKQKMVVHDLPWLLGSEEVARLREGAPQVFGEHNLFVMRLWNNKAVSHLHILLWRLHGFLSHTEVIRSM